VSVCVCVCVWKNRMRILLGSSQDTVYRAHGKRRGFSPGAAARHSTPELRLFLFPWNFYLPPFFLADVILTVTSFTELLREDVLKKKESPSQPFPECTRFGEFQNRHLVQIR